MPRFLDTLACRQWPGRDRPEMLFCERAHLRRADIARNHENRVVGRIPFAIGRQCVHGAENADLVLPADIGIPIRVVQE